MYEFKYHRPTTVRQAVNLLTKNAEAKILAGGHSLIPVMKLRLAKPSDLVDLSQVGKSKKTGGMLDPYSYLGGTLPVTANGVLKSKNGVASFVLESASISGVPMPVWMLQEIVSYYSKSAESPQGVSIEKPFALPAGIREIQIDRGQAVVIQ